MANLLLGKGSCMEALKRKISSTWSIETQINRSGDKKIICSFQARVIFIIVCIDAQYL